MKKKILKAIEEAYRKGLKDAEGLNDISPYLLISQRVAQELANKFCQPDVSGRSELLKDFVEWQIQGNTPYAGMLIDEHIRAYFKSL